MIIILKVVVLKKNLGIRRLSEASSTKGAASMQIDHPARHIWRRSQNHPSGERLLSRDTPLPPPISGLHGESQDRPALCNMAAEGNAEVAESLWRRRQCSHLGAVRLALFTLCLPMEICRLELELKLSLHREWLSLSGGSRSSRLPVSYPSRWRLFISLGLVVVAARY